MGGASGVCDWTFRRASAFLVAAQKPPASNQERRQFMDFKQLVREPSGR
jgi:hypothetical protein